MSAAPVLVLPGRGGSGPDHWQTHWEAADASLVRVQQRDWDAPVRDEWVSTLIEALRARGDNNDVILVAHSLSVSLVSHLAVAWQQLHPDRRLPVRGALLVAPSDVEAASYPPGTTGFAPIPLARLPFRSIVVASSDDPRVTLERARVFADAWGAQFEVAGALGHIGSASQLADWPQGWRWLQALRA